VSEYIVFRKPVGNGTTPELFARALEEVQHLKGAAADLEETLRLAAGKYGRGQLDMGEAAEMLRESNIDVDWAIDAAGAVADVARALEAEAKR
jgi:hypothetical protein